MRSTTPSVETTGADMPSRKVPSGVMHRRAPASIGPLIRGWLSVGSLALIVAGGAVACSAAAPPPDAEYPSLVLPARSEPAASSPRPSGAGAPSAAPASPAASEGSPSARVPLVRSPHGDLPDPSPLSERAQWSYPVSYDRGTLRVGEPELVCLPRPQPTPRRIGRFAFELWLGRELVERLRFDFPLLATEVPPEGPRRQLRETPRFAPGARVSVTLRVPGSERATSARILDRATGEVTEVRWPPPSAADAARTCPRAKAPAAPRQPAASSNAGR